MSGEMASLHSGLIQRTREPSEEVQWQRTAEKKAAQDTVKQYIQGIREEAPPSLAWLSKPEPVAVPEPIAKVSHAPQAATPYPAPAVPSPSPMADASAGSVTPATAPTPAPPPGPTPAPAPEAAPTAPEPTKQRVWVERRAAPPAPIKPINKPRPFGKTKTSGQGKSKEKAVKRKALTLRLDMDEYDRIIRAREITNRTAQDILETALSVYLNLLSIDED